VIPLAQLKEMLIFNGRTSPLTLYPTFTHKTPVRYPDLRLNYAESHIDLSDTSYDSRVTISWLWQSSCR